MQHIVIKVSMSLRKIHFIELWLSINYNSVIAETYIPDDILLYDINIDSESNNDRIKLRFSYDDVISSKIIIDFNYIRLVLKNGMIMYMNLMIGWVCPTIANKMTFHGKVTYFGQDVVLLMLF